MSDTGSPTSSRHCTIASWKESVAGAWASYIRRRDTKLRRFVALKFFPDGFAPDSQALSRFEREAQAASALNHPNICTIHEIDEYDGHRFIAMEFLDGQDLRHRISGKPMPIDQVLEMGIEIADALAAAHAKGIIHRDIKNRRTFLSRIAGMPRFWILVWQIFRKMPTASEVDYLTRSWDGDWHNGVHVARTGTWRGSGCARGSVFLWRNAI